MLQTGLLWFDDDAKRPLMDKIADAVARYNERVGGVPTVCQLNPASATLALQQLQKQKQQRALERTGRNGRAQPAKRIAHARGTRMPQFIPDPSLPVNYFFVGREDVSDVSEVARTQPRVPAAVEAVIPASSTTTVAPTPRATRRRQVAPPVAGAPTHNTSAPRSRYPKPESKPASAPAPVTAAKPAKRPRAKQPPAPQEMAPILPSKSVADAQPAKRPRRVRTDPAKTLPHKRTATREQASPSTSAPTARITPVHRHRRHKISQPIARATQPPLPLLADLDTAPARQPRRRAS